MVSSEFLRSQTDTGLIFIDRKMEDRLRKAAEGNVSEQLHPHVFVPV